MSAKYFQGRFKPKNPAKYKGNPCNITYRSSWEASFMMRLDSNPNVEWWQSEEIWIAYNDAGTNTPHRYFPDFVFKSKGQIYMVEIKPYEQTLPPVLVEGKRKSAAYAKKVMTFLKNQSKWAAAEAYAQKRGWQFRVLTERDLKLF